MNLRCFFRLHDSKWAYVKEGNCNQIKQCIRCNKIIERRESHAHAEWEYAKKGHCNQIKRCKRCNHVIDHRELHILEDCKYISEGTCIEICTCARCGEKKERQGLHKFGAWENADADEHKATCTRCGETKTSSHDWIDLGVVGEVYRGGATYAVTGYECETCRAFKDNAYG